MLRGMAAKKKTTLRGRDAGQVVHPGSEGSTAQEDTAVVERVPIGRPKAKRKGR